MSVQTTVPRPASKSVGAAMLGVAVTLTLFVVLFMTFLLAPLVLFAAALVGYLVMRPRAARRPRSAPAVMPSSISHDFGAGTQ